jgi:hypothetical protein
MMMRKEMQTNTGSLIHLLFVTILIWMWANPQHFYPMSFLEKTIDTASQIMKQDFSVFVVRGTRKIAVTVTTWPTNDGKVKFSESYFETSDLGITWRRVARSDVLYISVEPDPVDPNTAYRANGDVGNRLVLERSKDGGKTWHAVEARVLGTSEVLQHYGLRAFHPRNPDTIYLTGVIPGSQPLPKGSECYGLYVSHDEGDSVSLLIGSIDHLEFAISESRPETMYASMFHRILIKSDNGGRVWKYVGPYQRNINECNSKIAQTTKQIGSEGVEQDWIDSIQIDPHNHMIVYVRTDNEILKTADGGKQWCFTRPAQGARVSSMVVAGNASGSALFAGTDVGLFVSRDTGASWSAIDLHGTAR